MRHWNTGDWNTGDWNTGHWNTGDQNTGDQNTGDRNTGDQNTGHWNTGDQNTGDRNTGHQNTGDWNTGDWNTGDWNTGDWNTCDKETGFFNTEEVKKIRVFNKWCEVEEWENADKPNLLYFSLTKWIAEDNMSNEEKNENQSYKITRGYLKKYEYKQAFKESWTNASKEDKELVKNLPNFDADIFYEISGIRVDEKTCEGREIEIDGIIYALKKK